MKRVTARLKRIASEGWREEPQSATIQPMVFRFRHWWAAVLLAGLTPMIAVADGAPRIAVVVVSKDMPTLQQQGVLEGAAEAALNRASRFVVLPVHHAFNPVATKRREAKLEEAKALMNAGKQALEELDDIKAGTAYTSALNTLQDADWSKDMPVLVDAWTLKAGSHATGGQTALAKKAIEGVVALSPRAEFSPQMFPPELLKFADAQRTFATHATGELLVRTEPPGARVWVDGVYRGVSPVTVAGLTTTKHYISAAVGGAALAQSKASLGEEMLLLPDAELNAEWKDAVENIKRAPASQLRDSSVQTLGRAAQVDQVLLVVASKSLAGEKLELLGLRLEVRDGHSASFRTGTVNPVDPDQLAAFFDALCGPDAKRIGGKTPVHHYQEASGPPLETVAGISLLGAGAAALISGIAFGLVANNQAVLYSQTSQIDTTTSAALVRKGTDFALVADVSYLVALATAGTGVVLLVTRPGAVSAEKGDAPVDVARAREAEARRQQEELKKAEERAKEEERAREDAKQQAEANRLAEEKRLEEKQAEEKRLEEQAKAQEKKPQKLTKKQRAEEARLKAETQKKNEEIRLKREAEQKPND